MLTSISLQHNKHNTASIFSFSTATCNAALEKNHIINFIKFFIHSNAIKK